MTGPELVEGDFDTLRQVQGPTEDTKRLFGNKIGCPIVAAKLVNMLAIQYFVKTW
jgi:hypothetical protein